MLFPEINNESYTVLKYIKSTEVTLGNFSSVNVEKWWRKKKKEAAFVLKT